MTRTREGDVERLAVGGRVFAVLGADLLEVGARRRDREGRAHDARHAAVAARRRLDRVHARDAPTASRSTAPRPGSASPTAGPAAPADAPGSASGSQASAITAIEIRMRRQLERVLGALACRRVGREPADPLLVEAGEVVGVAEDERGADHPVDGAARRTQDRLDVPQALPRLLADGLADDRAVRVRRRLARHEDEPRGLHGLAVREAAHPSRVPPPSARSPCPCSPPLRRGRVGPMLGHSSADGGSVRA